MLSSHKIRNKILWENIFSSTNSKTRKIYHCYFFIFFKTKTLKLYILPETFIISFLVFYLFILRQSLAILPSLALNLWSPCLCLQSIVVCTTIRSSFILSLWWKFSKSSRINMYICTYVCIYVCGYVYKYVFIQMLLYIQSFLYDENVQNPSIYMYMYIPKYVGYKYVYIYIYIYTVHHHNL
jgi:hypothetical protein